MAQLGSQLEPPCPGGGHVACCLMRCQCASAQSLRGTGMMFQFSLLAQSGLLRASLSRSGLPACASAPPASPLLDTAVTLLTRPSELSASLGCGLAGFHFQRSTSQLSGGESQAPESQVLEFRLPEFSVSLYWGGQHSTAVAGGTLAPCLEHVGQADGKFSQGKR